jgi:hypothetical protein
MKKFPCNGNINCKAKNRKGEILNKIMQELSKYKFVKKQRKRVHKVDKNIKKCSDPLSFIRFRLHVFCRMRIQICTRLFLNMDVFRLMLSGKCLCFPVSNLDTWIQNSECGSETTSKY